ncbi:MAG: ribonuclease III [Oscillospiraceae bacterium]|jgi:ribonuclease-3|nr:ribonuclease III [Oscillospiraceae bacterium]
MSFEKKLNYKFNNQEYLETALTHSSYAHCKAKKVADNERLEFLGDAILSMVVADYLFVNYPKFDEGELSRLRSILVCEKSLCGFAEQLELFKLLKVRKRDLAKTPSVLADAFEALVAAIYLDAGLKKVRSFILEFVKPMLSKEYQMEFKDYKTFLQEIVQQNTKEKLSYVLMNEVGPAHEKVFTVGVYLGSEREILGTGTASSKKEAEQQAAKEVLKLLGIFRESIRDVK